MEFTRDRLEKIFLHALDGQEIDPPLTDEEQPFSEWLAAEYGTIRAASAYADVEFPPGAPIPMVGVHSEFVRLVREIRG